MSGTEDEDIDLLLAYSGSEYEPSSNEDYSSLSSLSSDEEGSDSDNKVVNKRKKIRNHDRKRKRLPRNRQVNGLIKPSNNSPNRSPHPITYKPFSEFMKDVVFTLSGFVNPLRSELRNKAIEMGAHYKPDWDATCTHLICAFRSTPKFDQVRGVGKIVRKEWIEDSHSSKKRYPWRRYCLDRRDMKRSESEGEIHELNCDD